jgi:hypothetical protein
MDRNRVTIAGTPLTDVVQKTGCLSAQRQAVYRYVSDGSCSSEATSLLPSMGALNQNVLEHHKTLEHGLLVDLSPVYRQRGRAESVTV